MENGVTKIAVLGAGLMGHGIAQVASQVGCYQVSILDINEELVDKGMKMLKDSVSKFVEKGKLSDSEGKATMARIHPTTDLAEALKGSQLVIEAATEDPKLKLDLYRRVSELAADDTTVASNTSSISITLLASTMKHPERVCGMHFFNPPQLMSLVEIIKGNKTSEETVELVKHVSAKMGKDTVLCKKDSPGFIVNRILVPALNEAVFLVQEGVADPEDIDKAVKLGLNWPMGPMQLLDYVGLDTTFNITQVFMQELQDSKYRPSPLLREMVRAGRLGRKTGKGFYSWDSPGATKSDQRR
ncbi:MAG TPA: 3-hydroxyacyl-CoA dehydrogenase family protein [Nitrososphaerales archaeon]|nr:3-hydroxyacyl-CoA dehydrogenase family protein [Nitrososphaerales archaeon]